MNARASVARVHLLLLAAAALLAGLSDTRADRSGATLPAVAECDSTTANKGMCAPPANALSASYGDLLRRYRCTPGSDRHTRQEGCTSLAEACADPQRRLNNGTCCAEGQVARLNRCVWQKCPEGEYRSLGKCRKPFGASLEDTVNDAICAADQVRAEGRCIDLPHPNSCADTARRKANGTCCPVGQVARLNRCVRRN